MNLRNIYLIFSALYVSHHASAQDRVFEIMPKMLENRSVEMNYVKSRPGSYTVAINFINLSNTLQSSESVLSVNGNSGILLTMKPINKDEGVRFSSYIFIPIRGKLKPKFKEDFCYVLPYKVGKKVRVAEMGYANEKFFGAEKQSDWNSYLVSTNQPDSVTAIRKGVVVEIFDKSADTNSEIVAFTTEKNYLIVEHEDGTLLRYSGFKQGSITVPLGETVLPGSVLGINAQTQKDHYSISLLLYYLNSADFESLKGQSLSKPKSLYKILTPKFTFNGSTCDLIEMNKEYTVFNSEEIIKQELSKKELKKYEASKENK